MRILTCFLPPTDGKATVAGYDVLEQSLGRQVLAEGSPGEFHLGKLAAPFIVVLGRVGIDSLVDAPMHRQVGLLVALDPVLIEYTTLPMTETLFTFLLVLLVAVGAQSRQSGHCRQRWVEIRKAARDPRRNEGR